MKRLLVIDDSATERASICGIAHEEGRFEDPAMSLTAGGRVAEKDGRPAEAECSYPQA